MKRRFDSLACVDPHFLACASPYRSELKDYSGPLVGDKLSVIDLEAGNKIRGKLNQFYLVNRNEINDLKAYEKEIFFQKIIWFFHFEAILEQEFTNLKLTQIPVRLEDFEKLLRTQIYKIAQINSENFLLKIFVDKTIHHTVLESILRSDKSLIFLSLDDVKIIRFRLRELKFSNVIDDIKDYVVKLRAELRDRKMLDEEISVLVPLGEFAFELDRLKEHYLKRDSFFSGKQIYWFSQTKLVGFALEENTRFVPFLFRLINCMLEKTPTSEFQYVFLEELSQYFNSLKTDRKGRHYIIKLKISELIKDFCLKSKKSSFLLAMLKQMLAPVVFFSLLF